jgi:hypothetical protein
MPLAIAGRSTRDLREGRKLNKRTHKSGI